MVVILVVVGWGRGLVDAVMVVMMLVVAGGGRGTCTGVGGGGGGGANDGGDCGGCGGCGDGGGGGGCILPKRGVGQWGSPVGGSRISVED